MKVPPALFVKVADTESVGGTNVWIYLCICRDEMFSSTPLLWYYKHYNNFGLQNFHLKNFKNIIFFNKMKKTIILLNILI